MHFLQKEHNLNKELCSTFMRNLTIHQLLDILPLASGHFLLEGKRNLPSWTNQQAPCPLAQLLAGFIQWKIPVGDGRRAGSGIWLLLQVAADWLRFSTYSHNSWEPVDVSFLVYNPQGVIQPFTIASPRGFTIPCWFPFIWHRIL